MSRGKCGMKNFNKTPWEDKQHESTFSQGLGKRQRIDVWQLFET